MLNTILRLRRDNDYNYRKIKDTFVPADGEICLVDTARDGLRAVCGDGISTFGELTYLDDFIWKGYFEDNKFYQDAEMTVEMPAQINKIYIAINKKFSLFIYHEELYHQITGEGGSDIVIPSANAQTAGVLKLYNELGYNEDGTMTQKAITEELNEKVEITLNKDEELLIFTY